MQDCDIVLVEDNPDDAALIMRALRRNHAGDRVRLLTDGALALDAFPEIEAARVVLLDLKLPKVSGLEVLKAIKGNPATRTVPVVILTSSREEPDIAAAYELGANSYIVKPVDFGQFVDVISKASAYWQFLNQRTA